MRAPNRVYETPENIPAAPGQTAIDERHLLRYNTSSIHKDADRHYPPEAEGHWRINEHHSDWQASPRRRPPEGHHRFSAGTETPSRSHYLSHRLRLFNSTAFGRGWSRNDSGGRFPGADDAGLRKYALGHGRRDAAPREGGAAWREECAAAGGYALWVLPD